MTFNHDAYRVRELRRLRAHVEFLEQHRAQLERLLALAARVATGPGDTLHALITPAQLVALLIDVDEHARRPPPPPLEDERLLELLQPLPCEQAVAA